MLQTFAKPKAVKGCPTQTLFIGSIMKKAILNAETLRNHIIYEPLTGIFAWKKRENNNSFNSRFAGKQAG
jgi:hypothetical protein